MDIANPHEKIGKQNVTDLLQDQAFKIPFIDGVDGLQVSPHTEELSVSQFTGEGESFIKERAAGRFPMLQQMVQHPHTYEQH